MLSHTLPILVLAFNRPDLLKDQLEFLNSHNCSTVYISIDGPRKGKFNEDSLVAECIDLARKYIPENRINIFSANQGCRLGVVGGINWFFERESCGLILEDDVRFNPLFLHFAAVALSRYEFEFSVGSISGYTPIDLSQNECMGANTFFHPYFSSWGWATWRSRWEKYSLEQSDWEQVLLEKRMPRLERTFWREKFSSVFDDSMDTWDYQFILSNFRFGWNTLVPRANLVTNVGFRPDATHTRNHRDFALNEAFDLDVNEHDWPNSTVANDEISRIILRRQYGVRVDLFSLIKHQIKAIIYRFV